MRPEWIIGLFEFFRSRLPSEQAAAFFRGLRDNLRPVLARLRESFTEEDVLSVFEEFERLLKIYKDAFDEIATPVIIFERSGVIQYVNSAYKTLTGFNESLPTEVNSYAAYRQFGADCLMKTLNFYVSSIVDGVTGHIVMPVEMLCYGNFVNCNLTITIKRDPFGMPLLMLATVSPNVVYPVTDMQLQNVIKKLGTMKNQINS